MEQSCRREETCVPKCRSATSAYCSSAILALLSSLFLPRLLFRRVRCGWNLLASDLPTPASKPAATIASYG